MLRSSGGLEAPTSNPQGHDEASKILQSLLLRVLKPPYFSLGFGLERVYKHDSCSIGVKSEIGQVLDLPFVLVSSVHMSSSLERLGEPSNSQITPCSIGMLSTRPGIK